MDTLLQVSSLWIFILLAIIVMIALVLAILSGVVRRSVDSEPKPRAPEAPKTEAAAPEAATGEAAGAPPRLAESAGTSFARAMQFLRSAVGGPNYRYQIPWFLVLGEPQCGKSALLSAAGVDLAPEAAESGNRALEWRFLDGGVIVAANGHYVRGGGGRETYDWSKLLRLFQNNRPRRPLDGVVVAIPATDLAGPNALDEAQLAMRAARMSEMLSQAQKVLGFSFPVYTIVTKCDELEGFGDFCRELPSSTDENIFGWSSPYHIDASFSADWVEEAFQHMAQDLQRLQSEVFVERNDLRRADRIFLFPEEFSRLKTPLRIYLDRLFRESAYREAFRFRGIYFCGDISDAVPAEAAPMPVVSEDLPPEILAEIPPPTPVKHAFAVRKQPMYVRQLFERKIFPEAGISRPLSNVWLARSRAVLAIQVTALALAAILMMGTAWSYRRLSHEAAELTPALQDMLSEDQRREEERPNLMLKLAQTGDVKLRSIFQPASMGSSLDDQVTGVMAYACNRWVLSNLHDSLQRRVATLLRTPAPAAAPADGDGDGAEAPIITSADALPEFKDLQQFLASLRSLEENRDIYESLRKRGSIIDQTALRKLVAYLYNANLAEYEPNGHFAVALTHAAGPPLEITPEQQDLASARVKRSADAIFGVWFGESALIADVEQLKSELGSLERGNITTHDGLQTLLGALSQVDNDLRSPEFRWVANTHIDTSGPFGVLLRKSAYLRPDTGDYIARSGDDALGKLRDTLGAERTALSGPLLDMKDGAVLSKGAKDLEVALENALNLPFMTLSGTRPIETRLDTRTSLIWKPDPLREATRLMDTYDRFVNESLGDAPARVRPVLGNVALDQMRRHVQNLVAESQNFQQRTSAAEQGGSDDETLAEVNSFRDVTAKNGPLIDIASRFGRLNAPGIRNAIMQILVVQSYNLLTLLDARLNTEDPYAAREGKFAWWNGKGTLSLDSYQVHNAAELAEYLNTQRDRIKFLVQQADPLVSFLNTWLPTRAESQTRTIVRWQRLVADYQQYDGKKPGATLAALEDFILTRMDKITPDNGCRDDEKDVDSRGLNQDYFQLMRSSLRSDIIERCRLINAESVYSAYTEIADLFNSTLAGHFPFGPLGSQTEEAGDKAVTDFFAVYDRNNKQARSTLKEDTRFGDSAARALQFLDQVEALKALVVPASPDAPKEPPFTVEFTPHFRVNQAAEQGGNQIIEWVLQVGSQLFRQREPDHPGRWRPGNPVRLSLRWANDSMFLPDYDGQSNVALSDRNAFFQFTDHWSLLAFLRKQQAAPAEVRQPDPNQYVLKFALKMKQDPNWIHKETDPPLTNTVVFMNLSLTKPGDKKALVIPAFPAAAPRLVAPAGGAK